MNTQYIKKNLSTIQLFLILVYPIIPLAIVASVTFLTMVFETKNLTYEFHKILPIILGSLFFLGGPAGLLGWYFILQKKYSFASVGLFIYGFISYTAITGFFILGGFVNFFNTMNVYAGLHSIYLLFTFWVIGKELFLIYKNYRK